MRLTVEGILTDFKGRFLLQRTGPNELAPITRPLEPGILPTETLARAFREDTSLLVMPVRLTGLYYSDRPPDGQLVFSFRCTMRGGDLGAGDEPRVGFFDEARPGLPARFQRRVEQALHHPGGPPFMEREGEGVTDRLGRLFGSRVTEEESLAWEVAVKVIVFGSEGQVVWVHSSPGKSWRLPATAVARGEAPWEAAGRLLADIMPSGKSSTPELALVETAGDRATMVFIFSAALDEPFLPNETLHVVGTGEPAGQLSTDDAAIVEAARRASTRPAFRLAGGSE